MSTCCFKIKFDFQNAIDSINLIKLKMCYDLDYYNYEKRWNFYFGTTINIILYIGMLGYFIFHSVKIFSYQSQQNIDNITLYNDLLVASRSSEFEPIIVIQYMGLVGGILGFVIAGSIFASMPDLLQGKFITMGLICFPSFVFMFVGIGIFFDQSITYNDISYNTNWHEYVDGPTIPDSNCLDGNVLLVYDGNITTTECTVYTISGTTQTYSQCCGIWKYDDTYDLNQNRDTNNNYWLGISFTLLAANLIDVGLTFFKLTKFPKCECTCDSKKIVPDCFKKYFSKKGSELQSHVQNKTQKETQKEEQSV